MLALFKEWLGTPDRLRLTAYTHCNTWVRFETKDVHAPTDADPSHALLCLEVEHKFSGYPANINVSTRHFEFTDTLSSGAEFCASHFFSPHMHEHVAQRCAFIYTHTSNANTR